MGVLVSAYDVPCNGCTLCCQGDAVRLLPQDDPTRYQTEFHPYVPGALMLAHKDDGDCIYLGPAGCTIHDTRPLMCREMDCRKIAAQLSLTGAKGLDMLGAIKMDVWRRGRELLKQQEEEKHGDVG